jgi:hypothetical protein
MAIAAQSVDDFRFRSTDTPDIRAQKLEIMRVMLASFPGLVDAADDTAAAAAGVPIGQLYHNAGAVRVRIA